MSVRLFDVGMNGVLGAQASGQGVSFQRLHNGLSAKVGLNMNEQYREDLKGHMVESRQIKFIDARHTAVPGSSSILIGRPYAIYEA